jgi:hypothetical protein
MRELNWYIETSATLILPIFPMLLFCGSDAIFAFMGFCGAGRSAVSLSAITLLFKTKRFKVHGNNS